MDPYYQCLDNFLIKPILTGRFFVAVSNFLVVGSFGSTNNQSDLAQCIPFQKNTTIVLRNDQVNNPDAVICKLICCSYLFTVITVLVADLTLMQKCTSVVILIELQIVV